MIAATIVARNYLAQAEVLARSFLRHHPDAAFVTLVIDGTAVERETTSVGSTMLPADLGLPEGEWETMAGIYSVMELATALKPALLRHLLTRSGSGSSDTVCYLDPDIMVYHPFTEIFTRVRRAGILLTPHVLYPLPRDGQQPDESSLMHAGIFNLGFIAVGQAGLPFLDWWHERLCLDAVVDLPSALFTDQRWIDWVPALFDFEVIRDPGLNVAYWNLHERPLRRGDDGRVTAGEKPLRFFHFSGYSPERPWQLSAHFPLDARSRLPDLPLVAELCRGYAESLAMAGFEVRHGLPYGFDTALNGLRLTPEVRRAYRRALKAAGDDHERRPATPIGPDGGRSFTRWLTTPIIGPDRLALGPWQVELWHGRPDLQAAFPDLDGADAARFRLWLDTDVGARQALADLHLPEPHGMHPSIVGSIADQGHAEHGWNIVGYLSAEQGVGEAARRMTMAVHAAGLATHQVRIAAPASRQRHPNRRHPSDELNYRDSLVCVNADQVHRTIGRHEWCTGGRRIGLWFWEVDVFPPQWSNAFDPFDEIWCTSRFTADVLSAVAPIPVRVVPLPVPVPVSTLPFTRKQLGFPPGFVFLFVFDFHSVFERKNPIGLVQAYRRAFGPKEGTTLVVKSINGTHHPEQLDRLRYAAGERSDIVVRDGYLDPASVRGLIEQSDCFVSLHRSEGFGLNLAAAMASGRPVVATDYSGNRAFMDEDNAFLVPSRLIEVGPGHEPYPPSARWADPDLDVAASMLRQVMSDPEEARRIGDRGRDRIRRQLSPAAAGAALRPLLLPTMEPPAQAPGLTTGITA